MKPNGKTKPSFYKRTPFKILFFNLFLFLLLLLLVEAVLWVKNPDYQYYYRSHPAQPDLQEILAKTDTHWLKPHPELGWVCQQKNKLAFPSPPWEGVVYQINQAGFRNAFEWTDTFPPSKKRILLLGDSFMFGIYLSEQQTIAAQLQKAKGDEYVFYNISVPAWGLDQMYLAYQKYIDHINPDQVILAFVDDDLMRSLEILFHGCGLKPCLKVEGNHLVKNEDNPNWWEYLCWDNQIGNRLVRIYHQQKAAHLAKFMLADIVRQEKEKGRVPSFVRIPALVDLQAQVPRKVFSMTDFMQTQNVPYLELYDALIGQPFEQYYIPDDGHFTPAGAKLLTEHLLPWIQ